MADASTTNLGLTKCEVNVCTDWGTHGNTNLDTLDANPGIKIVADDAAKTALGDTWAGRVVYQADKDKLYRYDGAKWIDIGAESKGICFYIDGTLAVEADAMSFIAPMAMTITGGKLGVSTAPTGASLICDINKNDTTLFTTQNNRPTIAADGTSATITAPDITSIAQGDKITLDIDQVGSTAAGGKLSLTLYCTMP